jgi:hypothetical protein
MDEQGTADCRAFCSDLLTFLLLLSSLSVSRQTGGQRGANLALPFVPQVLKDIWHLDRF